MGNPITDEFIIVGCGRVGAELALSLTRKNLTITVIDARPRAFDALGNEFRGRIVQGEAFDRDVLRRAGIETAHGLAAVTPSDSVNVVTARVARDVFRVPHVVARVYNPRRATIYEKLGLQTILSSSWGARRVEELLLHPDLQSVHAAGNGEVQIYEIAIPDAWNGRLVTELIPATETCLVAWARGGRGQLPNPTLRLQTNDILQVSATAEGVQMLQDRLQGKDKA